MYLKKLMLGCMAFGAPFKAHPQAAFPSGAASGPGGGAAAGTAAARSSARSESTASPIWRRTIAGVSSTPLDAYLEAASCGSAQQQGAVGLLFAQEGVQIEPPRA